MGFGATLTELYDSASSSARSAFNSAARTTQEATDALEHGYEYSRDEVKQAYDYGKQKTEQAYEYGKRKAEQAYDYSKKKAEQTRNYVTDKYNAAKKGVKQKIADAKNAADRLLNSHPAGAPIQECPLKSKADRVKARASKIRNAKEKLKTMHSGPAKTALAHATKRLDRTNYAVERLRLANDTYTVTEIDSSGNRPPPPEGWERVGKDELSKLGVNTRLFPQFRPGFRPDEYSDGFYPEVYKSKTDVFGEEVYVLGFRGTQGWQDWWEGNVKQAPGLKSEYYEQAKKLGRNHKEALGKTGKKLETTGDSLAGCMATAVAITSQIPGFTSDTAGVHPNTLENYDRAEADKLVQNYHVKGEILTSVQDSNVQRVVMAELALLGGAPAIVGMGLAARRAIVDQGTLTFGAAGPMYEVPALANPDEVAQAAEKGDAAQGIAPGLKGRLNNDYNLINKMAMHKNMNYVIAGVEQQKADDLAVIDRALVR